MAYDAGEIFSLLVKRIFVYQMKLMMMSIFIILLTRKKGFLNTNLFFLQNVERLFLQQQS